MRAWAKTNFSDFIEACHKLKQEVGVEMVTVMRWQMGLLCRDVILKFAADPKLSAADQKRAGERAIYDDLLRKRTALFAEIPEGAKVQPMKDTAKATYDAMLVTKPDGAKFLVANKSFYGNAGPGTMKRIHQLHRVKGRAALYHQKETRNGWTVSQRFYFPAAAVREYVKQVHGRVGRAKAAWMEAYEYFKGKVGMNLLPWNPPTWIRRHANATRQFGIHIENFSEANMTGKFAAGSELVYGRDPEDIVKRCVETRYADLSGPYALKRLEGRIRKFQPTRAKVA